MVLYIRPDASTVTLLLYYEYSDTLDTLNVQMIVHFV